MKESIFDNTPKSMYCFDYCHFGDDIVTLNGDDIKCDETVGQIHKWLERDFLSTKICMFCREKLDFVEKKFELDGKSYDNPIEQAAIWTCPNCAYWQFFLYENNSDSFTSNWLYSAQMSKAREFDDVIPEGCEEELSAWLRRDSKKWHEIDPTRFEKLVASIFKANYQHCDVIHVGKPDDGGVDVLFVESTGKQWLIQVKRRQKINASEGVGTIRNLLGSLVVNDVLNGIVVSTADHFTYRAKEAIGKASDNFGMTVRLIDKGKLANMLDPVLPYQPWSEHITKIMPPMAEKWNQEIVEFF